MSTFNILRITDGTSIADLLDTAPGIHLDNWTPAIQQPKGGGVFQDSPLATGRRRIYSQFANGRDNFAFKVNGLTRNEVAQRIGDLITLLEKAVEYWETGWQNTVVYLEMRTEGGNTQYAAIKNYTFLELDNPFAQPFYSWGTPTLNNLNLEIERDAWSTDIPGNSTAIPVITTGTDEQTTSFINNKWADAGLTHIYVDDGGVFGSNLVASTSFNLLPATPAVNDAIYFGNSSDIPFNNLIFDVGVAGSGAPVTWEIWTGAAWAALSPIQDDTGSFTSTGVNSVSFEQESNWASTTVNAVSALWVRARVTSITVPSGGTQQNRIVYTKDVPYIEIPSTSVLGDISALARLSEFYRGPTNTTNSRYIFGLRNTDRGSDFVAFLNFSDVSMPTGISAVLSAGTAFASEIPSPVGRAAFCTTFSAVSLTQEAEIVIDSTVLGQYRGRYQVFLVCRSTGTTTDFTFRLEVVRTTGSEQIHASADVEWSPVTTSPVVIDLGALDIYPDVQLEGEDFGTDLELELLVLGSNTTDDIYFYTFVLMPTDEMAIDASDPNNNLGTQLAGNGRYLDTLSTNPKSPLQNWITDESNNDRIGLLISIANGLFTLRPGTTQRLWILTSSEFMVCDPDILHEINLFANQRYLGLRGNE